MDDLLIAKVLKAHIQLTLAFTDIHNAPCSVGVVSVDEKRRKFTYVAGSVLAIPQNQTLGSEVWTNPQNHHTMSFDEIKKFN